MNKKRGTGFLVIGLLLIASALGLCCYNFLEDAGVGYAGAALTEQLWESIPSPVAAFPIPKDGELPVLGPAEDLSEVEYPDYLLDPLRDMPVIRLDGNDYIGVVSVPSQNIELPVLADCSMQLLKLAPCRFNGTLYQNNMVIAAHNYSSHFGKLTRLSVGDNVIFTDAEGNQFTYAVTEIETVKPLQTQYMIEGDWDLTLFTCTWGGASRVTVRCDSVQPEA